MRLLPILLILLPVALACRTIVLTEIGQYGENGFSGVRNTVNTSLADVRNTESLVTIDDKGENKGMQVALDKTKASPEFLAMIEKTAPGVTEALASAVASKGAATVLDVLTGLAFDGDGDEEEILDGLGEEALGELMEKEKERIRRTPEEKAAARAAREAAERGRR